MKMANQALYDDRTQVTPHSSTISTGLAHFCKVRLFRWSDLQILKPRGRLHTHSKDDVREEWEGTWAGRAVVVRVVRGSLNSQV